MLVTIMVFSAVLIITNLILNWDKWMIPVVIAGVGVSIYLQLFQKLDTRNRNLIFGSVLIFEVFYYSVNLKEIKDSTALFIVLIFLLTFTGEKSLHRTGIVVGIIAFAINVFRNMENPGDMTPALFMLHSLWQVALFLFVAFIAKQTASSWNDTEKQYIRRIDEVENENIKANDFLANVSHEIRTPVNAVMGLSSVLLREDLPEKTRESLENIYESGQDIAGKIGDILDFTEVDMKKLSVSNETYFVKSLLDDIINIFKYHDTGGIDVVFDLEPVFPAELKGDPEKIKKILWHLLWNGCKFTREGGVYVHLYPVKRDYGVNLVIEVIDTGIGMTEGEIEHIYDKFYQTNSGRSRMVGGLGLGIPIVNSFTRAMGGFLDIMSTPGVGTTVRVSIPQEVVDNKPCMSVQNSENSLIIGFISFAAITAPRVREFYLEMIAHLVEGFGIPFKRVQSRKELEEAFRSYRITHLFTTADDYRKNKDYIDSIAISTRVAVIGSPGEGSGADSRVVVIKKPFPNSDIADFLNHSLKDEMANLENRLVCPGVRVLVVDDEPMNLTVAKGILQEYEMEVHTAGSGRQAIELCEAEDYEIIFMDHMMPEMDGLEAMKKLREISKRDNKTLYIVALTANVISSAKEMFLSEGFDAFLSKPIDLSELERVLKRALPSSAYTYRMKATGQLRRRIGSPAWDIKPLDGRMLDIRSGLECCLNDEDFYREYLQEFSVATAANIVQLIKSYEEEDYMDYRVRVHLLKVVSRFLGATELYNNADSLEKAIISGDRGKISLLHDAVVTNCDSLATEIMVCAGGIER